MRRSSTCPSAPRTVPKWWSTPIPASTLLPPRAAASPMASRACIARRTTSTTGTESREIPGPDRGSAERLDSRLRASEDQRMHVMRALVGVDRLEVHHVTDDVELVVDAVAAMHVAGGTGDVQRL